MGPSALSYASDSGAVKICPTGGQSEGAKRAKREGGGCGMGVSVLPR